MPVKIIHPLFIFAIIVLSACKQPKVNRPTKTTFYFITQGKERYTDTLENKKELSPYSSPLYSGIFEFRGKRHSISYYMVDGPPTDDEGFCYTLDSLGVFYSASFVWPVYSSLATNNDSLNELIWTAKDHIIRDPHYHCYQCNNFDQHKELIAKPE